jgi:Zn-dependent peptidase ImmA (M78 family)
MLRHGFKSEARDIAAEVRGELGLRPVAPLNPHALAQHLSIPVLRLSEVDGCTEAADYFESVEPEVFSAVTVFEGRHRTIVHNDAHSLGRQHSNIAHELAHGLLNHAPSPALDHHGCRYWDQDVEDEANFLGGVLLVTAEAALSVVRRSLEIAAGAQVYGVSERLMIWMINESGARIRVRRERARRGRS